MDLHLQPCRGHPVKHRLSKIPPTPCPPTQGEKEITPPPWHPSSLGLSPECEVTEQKRLWCIRKTREKVIHHRSGKRGIHHRVPNCCDFEIERKRRDAAISIPRPKNRIDFSAIWIFCNFPAISAVKLAICTLQLKTLAIFLRLRFFGTIARPRK